MRAIRLAEAATLGSLLVDPAAIAGVARWLRVGDFTDGWHAAVYAVIRERHAAGQRVDAADVALQLRERVGVRCADATRVVDLLHAAPARPRPARYAVMVLESALRRELAEQGVLLRAAALSAALQQDARPVTTTTALVEAAVAAGERRWQAATGHGLSREESPCPGVEPVLRHRHRAVAADRLLAAHPDLDPREARDRERRLVAALVRRPGQLGDVTAWLHPQALLDPSWRAVYAAAVDLAEGGEPVDVVTVAWQVQRASRRLGTGPDLPALMRAVDAAVADDPGYLAALVAGDLLRRTADAAAGSLAAAAANPGLDPADLFDTARLLTAGLRTAAAGLPNRAGRGSLPRPATAMRSLSVPPAAVAVAGPVAR